MKTIVEASIEYAEKEKIVVTEDDYTHGLAVGFDAGFMKGVEFAQRWIPVNEELPEFEEDFLVKDEYGDVSVAFIYDEVFYPNRGNLGEITHWRPIEYK